MFSWHLFIKHMHVFNLVISFDFQRTSIAWVPEGGWSGVALDCHPCGNETFHSFQIMICEQTSNTDEFVSTATRKKTVTKSLLMKMICSQECIQGSVRRMIEANAAISIRFPMFFEIIIIRSSFDESAAINYVFAHLLNHIRCHYQIYGNVRSGYHGLIAQYRPYYS